LALFHRVKLLGFLSISAHIDTSFFHPSRLPVSSFTRFRNLSISFLRVIAFFFQLFNLFLSCPMGRFLVFFDCFTAQKYGDFFCIVCTA
ncbi:MAG: hypothetical protein ACI920_003524, partial [Saprospiraceae bacterium]